MAKITDALAATEKLLLSLEFTPPDRGGTIDEIYRAVEQLLPFNPQFINVTYHQPHIVTETRNGTMVRRPKRKKPGTVGICAAIRNKFGVETVPHILCGGFNKYETEDALIDLHYLGFRNLFVVRGDPPKGETHFSPEPEGHRYAADLVAQIAAMNAGHYLEELDDPEPTDFCIGVAGYPENHYESPSFDAELANIGRKVAAGASYIITQMFFSADTYFRYVEKVRAAGITVPVIPGIKPVTNAKQLALIPDSFHVALPRELTAAIGDARSPQQAFEAGTRYMAQMVYKLIDGGVPGIHIFTMGQGRSAKALLDILFGSHA